MSGDARSREVQSRDTKSCDAMDRRRFLESLGAGSIGLGAAAGRLGGGLAGVAALLGTPRILGATERGVVVESEAEYGGFLVEKLTGGQRPYQVDPERLAPMSEKYTMFSRNVWDPVRQDRPEISEDLTRVNLVEGRGVVPNQTRLDYGLMAAAWRHSAMGGGGDYEWDGVGGRSRDQVSLAWAPGIQRIWT